MAQDDWRVTVTLPAEEQSGRLAASLAEAEVEKDAHHVFGDRVIVGGGDDPGVVFLYAGTRAAAEQAREVVRGIVAEHGLDAGYAIHRWRPDEEAWELEEGAAPPDAKDAGEDDVAAGAPWEVRVEFGSHGDAAAMADRIESEADDLLAGYTVSVVRRWRYLLVGAETEEQAQEIADRIRSELPGGAELKVQPSGALAWAAFGQNPFAVFGGLGA
ncbi:MAG TPA: hypothetical protein VFB35_02245 [Gaiellaceae bacterium]|nr:hypothetical protein [Gaiellaceae bacterium]